MKQPLTARSFSAALTPSGVYLVALSSGSSGVTVTDHACAEGEWSDPAHGARTLARLVEARGGRGSRLDLAVSGFGSYHQILTLPRAPRDVLLPVVARELRRFYPPVFARELEPPVVEYVPVLSAPAAVGESQMNLLAAAVPRALISSVRAELLACGITLTHWTVLPRVMQRLYQSFAESDAPTAAVVLADGVSILGFFDGGDLRLFAETPRAEAGQDGVIAVVDRIERGSLYLRQQFAGSGVQRVLLSTPDEGAAGATATEISTRLGIVPEPFGPHGQAPGALLALGAALDAGAADSLQLLPPELRSDGPGKGWVRMLYIASMAIVVIAAAWWAWSGTLAEREAADRLARAETALQSRASSFSDTRTVVEARQAHARRAEVLRGLLEDRERLPELLWQISKPDEHVSIEHVWITPRGDGWAAIIEGSGSGSTSGRATAAVDAFYQRLRREFPDARLTLDRMSPATASAADPAIATTFRMSFIVPSGPEVGP